MKFYHAMTKQRISQNIIVGLYNSQGKWVTKDTEMEKVVVNYFKDMFNSVSTGEHENFLSEVPSIITESMNERLMRRATEEEVKKSIFMMHPKKAPGPDGMTVLFYQQAWSIIKKNILDLVNGFF